MGKEKEKTPQVKQPVRTTTEKRSSVKQSDKTEGNRTYSRQDNSGGVAQKPSTSGLRPPQK